MEEAKRRRDLGLPPWQASGPSKDTSPRVVSWLPLTRKQAQSFMTWTGRGRLGGIGGLVVVWRLVRFVGSALLFIPKVVVVVPKVVVVFLVVSFVGSALGWWTTGEVAEWLKVVPGHHYLVWLTVLIFGLVVVWRLVRFVGSALLFLGVVFLVVSFVGSALG